MTLISFDSFVNITECDYDVALLLRSVLELSSRLSTKKFPRNLGAQVSIHFSDDSYFLASC